MRGLQHWYRGPWRWHTDDEGSRWEPPQGCYTGLDLRSLPQQAKQGGVPGLGVFVGTALPRDLGSDYDYLGSGSFSDIKESAKLRDMLPSRTGYRPQGESLKWMLYNLLTEGSDPRGLDFAKPLIPDSKGMLDLRIGGEQFRQLFRLGKHPHSNRVLSVLRNDMDGHIADSSRGRSKDTEHYRRVLDAHCEKYKCEDWKQFVSTKERKRVPGRLKHETIYTDGFLASDALAGWTAVVGSWNNSGDTVRSNGSGASFPTSLRYNLDLSSDDHYSQIDYLTAANPYSLMGGVVRHSPSVVTFYYGYSRQQFDVSALSKVVGGTHTGLINTGLGTAPPHTDRVTASGSTLTLTVGGFDLATATDTAITGNLRIGICGHVAEISTGDNWIAEDVVTGPGITIVNLERSIDRGIERGIWTRGI